MRQKRRGRPSEGGNRTMASSCRVFRGLVKEVEEEINHFLLAENVRVLQLAQSETGDHITVTLIVDPAEGPGEDGR